MSRKTSHSRSKPGSPSAMIGSTFDANNGSAARSQMTIWAPQGRDEISTWERGAVNVQATNCYNNHAVLQFLEKIFRRNIVNIGILPIAMTRDERFNPLAETYFDRWASNAYYCDARGVQSFYKKQARFVPALFRTGGMFELKTRSSSGAPQLQSIDSWAVGSVGTDNTEGLVDGVRLDASGKRVGYRILTGGKSYRDVSVTDMLHVWDNTERTDQLREISIMYAGINSLKDLHEVNAYKKVAEKVQSLLAAAVTRPEGKTTAQNSFAGSLSNRTVQVVNPDGSTSVSNQATQQFSAFGLMLDLPSGSEVEFLQPNGSSEASKAFSEMLLREIAWCIGANPDLLLFLAGIGSAGVRFALDDMQALITWFQDLLNEQLNNPVWTWVIADAMDRGLLPRCEDPEWWTCSWQGPPKISIDQGRMGALQINQVKNSLLTWAEYQSGRGQNWRHVIRQRVREVSYAMRLCKEESEASGFLIDYHRDISPAAPGAAPTPTEPEPEPTPEPPADKEAK